MTPRPTTSRASCAASWACELDIATVEAKHKLSQNRGADDRAAVIAALRGEPGGGAAQIAELMSAGR